MSQSSSEPRLSTPTERALYRDCKHYRDLLCDVAHMGVEFDDERLGYVSVQIDRNLWNQIRRLSEVPLSRESDSDV